MSRISKDKFGRAVDLFCEGNSIREVAKEIGIAISTAHRVYRIYRQEKAKILGDDQLEPVSRGGYWKHKKQAKGDELNSASSGLRE